MRQTFVHYSASLCHSLQRQICYQLLAFGLLLYLLSSCSGKSPSHMTATNYAFRLKPGQDLKQEIENFVTVKQIKAGWINTCVGSLSAYKIRFANQPEGTTDTGHFEIVSITGTISVNGSHIHISVSDSTGKTIGGHLMDGCKIYTTAEIVITGSDNFTFKRENDGTTPWKELQVEEIKNESNMVPKKLQSALHKYPS